MGNRNRTKTARAALARAAITHIAERQSEAVDSAKKAAEQYAASSQQSTSTAVHMSEVDGAYERLRLAVGALNAYVSDLTQRLAPVLRQVPVPTGAKMDRAAMHSQIGTKIAQEADEVEAVCHGIANLLATLAV